MRRFEFQEIGVVHSALADKFGAPRQPFVADDSEGRIVLLPNQNFGDALADLTSFSHIWVIFVFDRNATWHPKVMPPMGSAQKRGVFATRSPHRPNPIGMSVVRLLGIDGLTLRVSGLDILDGTPVLDIKPYVPVADIVEQAGSGWLKSAEPKPMGYDVVFMPEAEVKLVWWQEACGEDLRDRIARALQMAPTPGAFKRIRKGPDGALSLGLPGWRVYFRVKDNCVVVGDLRSAHKPSHLANDPTLHHHREFIAAFEP